MAAAAIAVSAAGGVKVACIGDSITYGYGLADRAKDSYPAQLQKMLDGKFPGKYEVRNFGNSGRGIYLDSMRGHEKRGFRWMPEHKAALAWKPDIVISNLGINDNGEYIKEYTGGRKRGQFIDDYLALLEDYRRANPKVKIYIWTKLSPLAEGQRFVIIGEDRRMIGQQVGHGLRPFRNDIDHGGDLHPVEHGFESGDMLPGHDAAADQNYFVFHRFISFMS